MSRFYLAALVSAGLASWSGCSSRCETGSKCIAEEGIDTASSSLTRANPTVPANQLSAAAQSEASFAIDLYKKIEGGKSNLFFSPHSIVEALTMTYAGAKGTTQSEMRAVLHLSMPDDQQHAAMNALDLALQSRGAGQKAQDGTPFRLTVANALWGQQGHNFLPTFLDTIAVNYGTGINLLDFIGATEASRVRINTWVSDKTDGKITDLIPPGHITPDTKLVLTNAIYFNAAWATKFEKSATTTLPFQTSTGSVSVPTMHETTELASAVVGGNVDEVGYHAVALPYAGNELSMLVICPDDFAAFDTVLTADKLNQIIESLKPGRVELSLPKWKLIDETSLGDPLQTLGMQAAFKNADFSGIDGALGLQISDVLHKAFVAVDEDGTEAAAATAVLVKTTSVPIDPPTVVKVDKPFLYIIRDNATGAVVFLGRIMDPTK